MMGRLLLISAIVAFSMASPAPAAAAAAFTHTHIVGGSFGWKTPPNISFYHDWAKSRTFGIGDKIVFLFRTGAHNIIEVNEEEFKNCTQENAIDMYYDGPITIELVKAGTFYYYCGVGIHCELGQKLKVTVVNREATVGTSVYKG